MEEILKKIEQNINDTRELANGLVKSQIELIPRDDSIVGYTCIRNAMILGSLAEIADELIDVSAKIKKAKENVRKFG